MELGRLMQPAAMSARHLQRHCVEPALVWLHEHHHIPPTEAVRVFLGAVAQQETGLRHRVQMGGGPARGLWQFEPIAVRHLLAHPYTAPILRDWCDQWSFRPRSGDLHDAMEHNDGLAALCARLLVLADPKPVPIGQAEGWPAYLRIWRPGKPRPEHWGVSWHAAVIGVATREPPGPAFA